jgi:hypothetical protein
MLSCLLSDLRAETLEDAGDFQFDGVIQRQIITVFIASLAIFMAKGAAWSASRNFRASSRRLSGGTLYCTSPIS